MKLLLYLLLLISPAVAQYHLPKVYMTGTQSPDCMEAVQKVFYIESRIGVPTGHKVYVECDEASYKAALKSHDIPPDDAPYGFSDRSEVATYLNAADVLATSHRTLNHGQMLLAPKDFGAFLIAHEVGHFATGVFAEEQPADTWAIATLAKRVTIPFEDAWQKIQEKKR